MKTKKFFYTKFHYYIRFLVGARITLKFIRNKLESNLDKIRMFYNYDENLHIYGMTVPSEWDYSKEQSCKKDDMPEKKRIYVHLYFNIEKAVEDEIAFDKRISLLYEELKTHKTTEKNKKQYQRFF